MDYDMMCRFKKVKAAFINLPLIDFDDSGVSTQNYLDALSETRQAYIAHFGYSLKMEIWHLRLKLLHLLQRTSLGRNLFALKRFLGLENM